MTRTYLIIAIVVLAFAAVFVKLTKSNSANLVSQGGYNPFESLITDKIVPLSEENNSGVKGVARLSSENGKVKVTIDIVGEPDSASEPAHVHIGQCPGVGIIFWGLNNVEHGTSVTTIDATLQQVQEKLPLVINIHDSVENKDKFVACGQFPTS